MKRKWVMVERGRLWRYLDGKRILGFIVNAWDSWDSFEYLGRKRPGKRMLNMYGQSYQEARRTVEREFHTDSTSSEPKPEDCCRRRRKSQNRMLGTDKGKSRKSQK